MKLQAFRVGDVIPEGARHVRSAKREIPGSGRERVVAPRSIFSWIGITETVAWVVQYETVEIYEVP